MVRWDKEFGIAECLQCTDAEDDLLPCMFGGIDLQVEFLGVESVRLGFDAIPIGPQSNYMKRIPE
jgi:hypothetical protein